MTETLLELHTRDLLFDTERILRAHGTSLTAIIAHVRQPAAVCDARREVYALLRERGLSFPTIGRLLGRHHATVLQTLRYAGDASYRARRARSMRGRYWQALGPSNVPGSEP